MDNKEEKAAMKKLEKIIREMRRNTKAEDYPVWKNIPLAREMLDILRNKVRIEKGEHIDASGITVCCDCIFLEDFLNQRDVPRLCLEFLKLRKLAQQARTPQDEKYDDGCFLNDAEANRIQNNLESYIDPGIDTDWWLTHCSSSYLKFDPVERTPEWEENIYEVEKELDRQFKGIPRGMGFCHAYWPAKRAVLAQKGIEWRTPSQMNPRVMFD